MGVAEGVGATVRRLLLLTGRPYGVWSIYKNSEGAAAGTSTTFRK